MYQEKEAGYWLNHLNAKASQSPNAYILQNFERFDINKVTGTVLMRSREFKMAYEPEFTNLSIMLRNFVVAGFQFDPPWKFLMVTGPQSQYLSKVDHKSGEYGLFLQHLVGAIIQSENDPEPLNYIIAYRNGTSANNHLCIGTIYRLLDVMFKDQILDEIGMAELCAKLLAM